MAILLNPPLTPLADAGDPDDFRLRSTWSGPLVDPISSEGYVNDLCVVLERIAPGERIPLHRHQIDEAIVVESGEAEVRLGDQSRTVAGRSFLRLQSTSSTSSGTPRLVPKTTRHNRP